MSDKTMEQIDKVMNLLIEDNNKKGNKVIVYAYIREGKLEGEGSLKTRVWQTSSLKYDYIMLREYINTDVQRMFLED